MSDSMNQATKLRYEETVAKAQEFMRSNMEKPLTVLDIAAEVSCSQSHLRDIFKTVTGRAVLGSLQEIRLEKAKELMLTSSRTITEIIFAVGFENPSSFSRLFRRATGTSPHLFREAMAKASSAENEDAGRSGAKTGTLVFRDDFSSPKPSGKWKFHGRWKQADGAISAADASLFNVALEEPLPANTRIEFDARVVAPQPDHKVGLYMCLTGTRDGSAYCSFDLLNQKEGACTLKIGSRIVLWSSESAVVSGQWHAIRLELSDNRFTLHLDGRRVFQHRDLFPPAYSRRDRFTVGSYDSAMSIRRFRLHDLGFQPVVPEIRQGDTLFNAGLYQEAQDFYVRHITNGHAGDDEAEYRFKAALCLMRQGQREKCVESINSLLAFTQDAYWRRESTLLLLEAAVQGNDLDEFTKLARTALRDNEIQDGVRPLFSLLFYKMRGAGFNDKALSLVKLWAASEKPYPFILERVRARLANQLKNMNYFTEAQSILKALTRSAEYERAFDALIMLSDISLQRCRLTECRNHIKAARELTSGRKEAAWCDIQEAACLRTEGRFSESIALLRSVVTRHPASKEHHISALNRAVELLHCTGQQAEAQSLEKLIHESAGYDAQTTTAFGRNPVVLRLLMNKQFAEAGEYLLNLSTNSNQTLTERGLSAVSAGIMMELAGRKTEANRIWNETEKNFPPKACYFWGSLARSLASSRPDRLEQTNFFWIVRSEIFFLTALLYRNRHCPARAAKLFALSVKEDPTLRWPSFLAKEQLELLKKKHKPAGSKR